MTVPGLVGCLKWWLPLTLTNSQPSFFSSFISALLFTSCPCAVNFGVVITLSWQVANFYHSDNPVYWVVGGFYDDPVHGNVRDLLQSLSVSEGSKPILARRFCERISNQA